MLLINKTKCTQILGVKRRIFPIEIHPGVVFDPSNYCDINYSFFEKFDPRNFYNQSSVSFIRNYAMGDILQLIPVIRKFKQIYNVNNVTIFTDYKYVKELKYVFSDICFVSNTLLYSSGDLSKYGIIVNLDGVLEKDHDPSNLESQEHRVKIYFDFLNMEFCSKLNWNITPSFQYNIENKIFMETSKMKKIGLQIRGSSPVKTLPYNYIVNLAKKLSEKYVVYLIDYDKQKGFEGNNIVNTCGKLNVFDVIYLLSKLDCCITMDSGILWLCHSANCPVLTILGPTRAKERISLHPQYPQKAKAINIAEEIINCKPCCESQIYCKRKINCMNNFNYDILTAKIMSKLKEIIGE